YYFGLDVDESDVLEAAAAAGGLDPSAGVSALALVRSLGVFGVPAQGYRLTPEALADYFRRGGLPVIAHATRPRQHYVVVVGLVGDYALVADPSWGRRVERWVDFAADKGFSGVVLVPVPEAGLAAAAADAQRLALAGAARELRRLDRVGAEAGRRRRAGGAAAAAAGWPAPWFWRSRPCRPRPGGPLRWNRCSMRRRGQGSGALRRRRR